MQNASRLSYTVSPSTREIIPLESVDATFVMTATSNALHLIFSSRETHSCIAHRTLAGPLDQPRDQAGAGRKHCQREIRGGRVLRLATASVNPRESERAVIEVVVGRVEARAGLRRAKCGCCNYNV